MDFLLFYTLGIAMTAGLIENITSQSNFVMESSDS